MEWRGITISVHVERHGQQEEEGKKKRSEERGEERENTPAVQVN